MRRTRALFVPAALLSALFLGGLTGGYVYSHEPARNTLEVRIAADGAPPGSPVLSGSVTSVDGDRLTLSTAAGPVTVALPAGVLVDELIRAPEGLAGGARVNVGVQATQYGLVVTGLVAIEGAP